jgi:hypothetical protein
MGYLTGIAGDIDPLGTGDDVNASINRDMISGDPTIAKDRDANRARLLEVYGQNGDETLAKYGRTIDEGAFAPVFSATANQLDGRSFGADVGGAKMLNTGFGTMGSASADLASREAAVLGQSTAGIQQAAGAQSRSADLLARQYAGNADPSAAQAQLQSGTDAALRAQLAAARSGGNPAAAYQAQLIGAQTLQTAANQAATLRAQEQQAVRGDMLAAQGAATNAQTGLVGTNVGLQTTAAGLAGQRAEIGQAQAGLGVQSQQRADSLTGQAAQLREADRASAQQLDKTKGAELQGARDFQTGVSSALTSGTETKQAAEDARMKRASGFGGSIIGGIAQAFSDERSKAKIKDLEAENSLLKGVSDYLGEIDDTDEDKADENAFLARHEYGPQRAAYDSQQTSGGIVDPWAQPTQRRSPPPQQPSYAFAPLGEQWGQPAQAPRQQAPQAPPERTWEQYWDQTADWVTSDERAKRAVDEMHARAPAKSFEYQSGYGPPGRREGVMAQDLERSEMGRSLVSRDPETGMRRVDTPQLTMANTAEISLLREEIEALKKGRR